MKSIIFTLCMFFVSAAYSFEKGTSFYWKIEGSIANLPNNYDVYGLDLDIVAQNPGIIRDLQSHGKRIVCYFSAGTYELDRKPNRYDRYYSGPKGSRMAGWNELWLDIRRADVRAAHSRILQDAKLANCDAVEPDNVDHSTQGNIGIGSVVTAQQNIAYLQWLGSEARAIGIKIALKNTGDHISSGRLENYFDFMINEQCFTFSECDKVLPFSQAGKAVYIAEYKTTHESAPYPMRNFARDCRFAKDNGIFFFVYKTQSVNGISERICW